MAHLLVTSIQRFVGWKLFSLAQAVIFRNVQRSHMTIGNALLLFWQRYKVLRWQSFSKLWGTTIKPRSPWVHSKAIPRTLKTAGILPQMAFVTIGLAASSSFGLTRVANAHEMAMKEDSAWAALSDLEIHNIVARIKAFDDNKILLTIKEWDNNTLKVVFSTLVKDLENWKSQLNDVSNTLSHAPWSDSFRNFLSSITGKQLSPANQAEKQIVQQITAFPQLFRLALRNSIMLF